MARNVPEQAFARIILVAWRPTKNIRVFTYTLSMLYVGRTCPLSGISFDLFGVILGLCVHTI
jgi:hypothetical protein